jgi:hypothetical protein
MAFGNPIFQIPIYRCSPQEHQKEVEEKLQWHLDNMRVVGDAARKAWRKKLELRYDNAFWARWRYNHIIGWLRLYVRGSDILAELYWIDAERIVKQPKRKTLVWSSYREIHVSVSPDMSNRETYEALEHALVALQEQRLYRSRYIDMTEFRNLGPYVKWKSLITKGQR